jgi:hypothetical protein
VDLRKGLQGNAALVAAQMQPLRDDIRMTDAAIEDAISRVSGMMGFVREQAGRTPVGIRAGLKQRAADPARVRRARGQMLKAALAEAKGMPPDSSKLARMANAVVQADLVQSFADTQVILLDEKRAYEVQRDERLKQMVLAPWQIRMSAAERPKGSDDILFQDLLPDVTALQQKRARLEQRIAVLRHIEALRLFAAQHNGKLPEKLDDLSVPLPLDPVSGMPFSYAAERGTAQLRGGRPQGTDKNTTCDIRYEVALRK